MNTKKFKVGLVGCGGISLNHLSALTSMNNVKVCALCDIKEERAIVRRDEFNLDATVYKDYYEMLEKEELDTVHIATPHYLHCEMAIAALRKGINVFLEKPMCISQAEIDKLIKEEEKSKATVCVCFQNRFAPETEEILRIVEADGGAISAFGAIFWGRNENYYTESGWRGSIKTEGGGVMINQAIHTIDLLTLFLGKPKKLWATKSNHHLKGIIDCEDSCEGLIEFENGKRGNFYATTSFAGGDKTILYIKTQNHKIELSYPALIVDGKVLDVDFNHSFIGKECYGTGHPFLIKKFYDALANGEPSPVPLSSAQYAVRILLAAYRSNDEEAYI